MWWPGSSGRRGLPRRTLCLRCPISHKATRRDHETWRRGLAELLGTWPAPADRCLLSITGLYRDAVLDDVSHVPGFAAKAREDAKLDEDFRSASPVSQVHGGRHRLVPFVLEEGGRFGDHALSSRSCLKLPSPGPRRACSGSCQSRGPAAPTLLRLLLPLIGYT